MKVTYLALVFSLISSNIFAQIDIGGKVKNKVNQRIERKTDQAIDKALDETEQGAKDAAKGGSKEKKPTNKQGNDSADGPVESENTGSAGAAKPSLKTYGKFDFVPGERVIVEDNFSQVELGDFPADWNTNSGGEIVTVDGMEGKWLAISKEGVFIPDYITDLPENFTLQYDVICNEDYSYYSDIFTATFVATANRQKLGDFGRFSKPDRGVRVGMHPTSAGGGDGRAHIDTWDSERNSIVQNEVSTTQFSAKSKNHTRVSIWRQKQRLRVYFNEEKVLDIPRAFDATAKYNTLVIGGGGMHQAQDRILISNIRLAVGAPDTRNKLITEGRFVTHGILFDSGSDKLKAESYGALKDIANVLIENPTVKVKIIGHTDSDGDDSANMELSKKRSLAVKEALSKEFAIDGARMETDGKGESMPSGGNDTAAGKANNRRVEFVKL
jgi:OOP family OmpA-OmpF porin